VNRGLSSKLPVLQKEVNKLKGVAGRPVKILKKQKENIFFPVAKPPSGTP
jgi:hypothetical protein